MDWVLALLRMMERAERNAARNSRQRQQHAVTQITYSYDYAREAQDRLIESHRQEVFGLCNLHRNTLPEVDWKIARDAPVPVEPVLRNVQEAAALRLLQEYHPGFTDRLFKRIQRKRHLMNVRLERARRTDSHQYQVALLEYEKARHRWQECRSFAQAVLSGDLSTFESALSACEAFKELADLGYSTKQWPLNSHQCLVQISVHRVPSCVLENPHLTNSGRYSTATPLKSAVYDLLNQHLSSCAIHAARQVFRVLPVSDVVVSIIDATNSDAMGSKSYGVILSAQIARDQIPEYLNPHLAPAAALHISRINRKFTPSRGFSSVPALTFE